MSTLKITSASEAPQGKFDSVIGAATDHLRRRITYRYGVLTISKHKHLVIRTVDNGLADFHVVATYVSYSEAFSHAAKDHRREF